MPSANQKSMPPDSAAKAASSGWIQRWGLTLALVVVLGVCTAVLVRQRGEIARLGQANAATATDSTMPAPTGAVAVAIPEKTVPVPGEPKWQAELERLSDQATELRASVAELEQLQHENQELRAVSTAPVSGAELPEEYQLIEDAREKAWRIGCVNNLKQLGLAARMWAMDHGDLMPPDIVSMSNELVTPKILICPADSLRKAASDWISFTPGNCSYEFLAPSATETEPSRVLARCPSHGNFGLVDGSVQMLGTEHQDLLVTRDGKLYLEEK